MHKLLKRLKPLVKSFWWVPVIFIVVVPIAWIIVLRITGYPWADWTGFGNYTGTLIKDNRGKTLWDVMQLVIIPAAFGIGGYWLNKTSREREQKIAHERNEKEKEIAATQMRETTLQTYFDRMTELLLDKGLRRSETNDDVRHVARTRTLTTLSMLDPGRKGVLIRFLREAELITKDNLVIYLRDADLRNADLNMVDLRGASLSGADLGWAELLGTNLTGADLAGAFLDGANLTGAILTGADLDGVDLTGTKFSMTTMPDGTKRE
jgi:hypothetical protein